MDTVANLNRQPAMPWMIPYNDKLAPLEIRNTLYSLIPDNTEHIAVIAIGSSLISGDSLGPFVGTLLHNLYPNHLTIAGTLQKPLDAATLIPELSKITLPNNSFVIAVDSVLGSSSIVNTIIVREGALKPGEGLGQTLPVVGDCSIMGVVCDNKQPSFESTLVYADLHIIYRMAVNVAVGISLAVRQYFKYPSTHPILIYR